MAVGIVGDSQLELTNRRTSADSMPSIADVPESDEPRNAAARKRDEFPLRVKRNLAARVNNRCSNPDCKAQTTGPHSDPAQSVNIGVAAHITAASVNGPRYDPSLTAEQRRSDENGIWLCQNHAKLVDDDDRTYSVEELRAWKEKAEALAKAELGQRGPRRLREGARADRDRRAMIRRVRRIWIDGVLKKSLFHEVRILLGLSERPDAVERPLDLVVMRPNESERPLPSGTRIVDIYDDFDEALLILGAPGSGKTTELLCLAKDLLDRAEEDPDHPIPVIFTLSTWAKSRKPIQEWLRDELQLRYQVPKRIAQKWIDSEQVMPLLDGLDEVEIAARADCAEAICLFRQSHGFLPLVVTSRTYEYESLNQRLCLPGAILVQPLTRDQVDFYLAELGAAGKPIIEAIKKDRSLKELLDSPLFLNIVALTYVDRTNGDPRPTEPLKTPHDRLFESYVDQMLARRRREVIYTTYETKQSLSWLANQLHKREETEFFLERLQFDWLPNAHRWTVRFCNALALGLVFAAVISIFVGLVPALFWTPLRGGILAQGKRLPPGLFNVLDQMVTAGLLAALPGLAIGFVLRPDREIVCVESVRWNWRPFWSTFFSSLSITVVIATLLVVAFSGRPIGGVLIGVYLGVPAALLFGLSEARTFTGISTTIMPNHGIHRCATTAFIATIVCGVTTGAVGAVFDIGDGTWYSRLLGAMFFASFFGLIFGLNSGGEECLRHIVFRIWLARASSTPWNYVKFLDYCADRILLRKVGGGYMFIHRMLLEHFAARYVEPGTMPKKELSSGEHQPA